VAGRAGQQEQVHVLDDILDEPAYPEVRRDLPGDLVEFLSQVPGQGLAGTLVPGEEVDDKPAYVADGNLGVAGQSCDLLVCSG
jgi:hypothetical protein